MPSRTHTDTHTNILYSFKRFNRAINLFEEYNLITRDGDCVT